MNKNDDANDCDVAHDDDNYNDDDDNDDDGDDDDDDDDDEGRGVISQESALGRLLVLTQRIVWGKATYFVLQQSSC